MKGKLGKANAILVGEDGEGGLKKDLSDAQDTLSKMDALLSQYTDPKYTR